MMKEDMAVYLNAMTLGDLNTFEEIISHQYRKFVRFYKLVKHFSSSIDKLKYSFKDSSSLDVVITVDEDADVKYIKSYIQEKLDESKYDGTVRVSKQNIHISLQLVEG